ncbi:MAG: winged helix-turn-helix transcriptional regulator [Atopobiaceae bacterium]|nr:winged helix-turn-helix transcriptional regulator [Atopobiaceae bacterium]
MREGHTVEVDELIESYLSNEDIVYEATQIFDALSDYTRFQILSALCVESKSVSELKDICHVTQSAISHQLRLLRDRGLVFARREGQRVIYALSDEHVATLMRVGLEHAAEAVSVEGE